MTERSHRPEGASGNPGSGHRNRTPQPTERDWRERALRAERRGALLEAMLAATPDHIYVYDRTGRYVYASRTGARALGLEPGEMAGKTWRELGLPPAIMQPFDAQREAVFRTGESVQGEIRFPTVAGLRDYEYFLVPAPDEHRRVKLVVATVRDITERKRVEEELEQLRRRTELILSSAGEGIYGLDTAGNTTFVNPAAEWMLGWGPGDLIGKSQHAIIHHTRLDGTPYPPDECPIYAAFRDGTAHRVDTEVFWRKDGTSFPVDYLSTPIWEDGDLVGAVVTFRDISERKRAEESTRFLAEASRTLAATLDYGAMLDRLLDLLVPRRADYVILDLVYGDALRRVRVKHRDPAAEDLAGALCRFPPSMDREMGVARVLKTGEPELIVDVSDGWLDAVSQNEEHGRILRRLGAESVLVVPLRVRGQAAGALTLVSTDPGHRYDSYDLVEALDLAGRAGLALENARLYRESQQATRIRDQVLGIVSHDLRNPLHTIGLASGLLQELLPEEERPVEAKQLGVIRSAVGRANRLIGDLLDVARMEAGRLSVEAVPEDSVALARQTVEIYRPQAEEKGLHLDAKIPDTLPAVLADHDRILQVFGNLVGNAIKFTSEGGRILIAAAPADGTVRFCVSDTGPGIRAEDLPRLFDPFWQARKGAAEGAGLGLAIARGIIEAHGGRIGVESEVGVGTTFYFTLPVARAHGEGPPRVAD